MYLWLGKSGMCCLNVNRSLSLLMQRFHIFLYISIYYYILIYLPINNRDYNFPDKKFNSTKDSLNKKVFAIKRIIILKIYLYYKIIILL